MSLIEENSNNSGYVKEDMIVWLKEFVKGSYDFFFFFLSELNDRLEGLIVAILLERDYSNTSPLRATQEGSKHFLKSDWAIIWPNLTRASIKIQDD